MNTLILASTSPRRKELIEYLGLPYEIHTEKVEEILDHSLSPMKNVEQLARLKASAVASKYPNHWVIGADTIVCIDGRIMGKPKNANEAKEMLRQLSGKTHQVITGVAMIGENTEEVFHEITKVKMKPLSEEEIETYVATGEPLDKAGAYGIQGKGALYIEGIEGDYYNVVGLPVHQLYTRLKKV